MQAIIQLKKYSAGQQTLAGHLRPTDAKSVTGWTPLCLEARKDALYVDLTPYEGRGKFMGSKYVSQTIKR